jgi:hypothetical protein
MKFLIILDCNDCFNNEYIQKASHTGKRWEFQLRSSDSTTGNPFEQNYLWNKGKTALVTWVLAALGPL